MFYTAIWCSGNEKSFQETVPLDLLGESLQRYGTKMPFCVAVLEGFGTLSREYVRRLESLGLELVDAGDLLAVAVRKYPQIDRCYSRYERNCFLRWPVFARLQERDGQSGQFWHLDSDMILHSSLEEIAEATAGRTFILQGTPAFVSVADARWLEVYERELSRLDTDIAGYSAEAAGQMEECARNDTRLCNQTLYRNPIGSDQDFIEYLVGSGKLMQEQSTTILGGRFFYVQNPLNLHDWDQFQCTSPAGRFEERGCREIWYGGRRIPFMHYQNAFCSYADVYLKLSWMHVSLLARLLRYRLRSGVLAEALPLNLFRKMLKHGGLQRSRRQLVERLMEKTGTGEMELLRLLNLLTAVGADDFSRRQGGVVP